MSFGSPIEGREPFDVGLRTAALENHVMKNSLDQLRVVYASLQMIFENKKYLKESEINERLSSIESSLSALQTSLKMITSTFEEANNKLFEMIKGHVQYSIMQVMEKQSDEIQRLIETKCKQLENVVKDIECYDPK